MKYASIHKLSFVKKQDINSTNTKIEEPSTVKNKL